MVVQSVAELRREWAGVVETDGGGKRGGMNSGGGFEQCGIGVRGRSDPVPSG
jgi:hypothetical protein